MKFIYLLHFPHFVLKVEPDVFQIGENLKQNKHEWMEHKQTWITTIITDEIEIKETWMHKKQTWMENNMKYQKKTWIKKQTWMKKTKMNRNKMREKET